MIEPWREAFDRNPEQALADLFSGRAGLGADLRLDAPDILYQEFPNRPDQATARERLDQALLHWLHGMRRDYSTQVRRLGYAVYAKRLCDALVAVQLLDLPRTNHQARETLDAWLRWLAPLRLAPERDPALECWRILTRRQPDGSQTAAWLRLAADPRPEYLTVALAGLEGLPNPGNARTDQVLMLHGLLRHSVNAYATAVEARACFNRHFAALRGMRGPFPRAPAHWQQVLAEALEGFARASVDAKMRDLAASLQDRPRQRHATGIAPAPRVKREALKRDIREFRQSPELLTQRLFALLDQNQKYAEATGDSYYFVRTLHSLGSRILAADLLPQNLVGRFGSMIEHALVWEPMNPYCWMLWADWFAAQDLWDAREWALREAVRLFPDNEPSRVELARLLIRRGEAHWDEAERWLRQVVERSSKDEHSRVELARLLIRRGEPTQASALLTAVLQRNRGNAIARQVLELLESGAEEPWGNEGEADLTGPMHQVEDEAQGPVCGTDETGADSPVAPIPGAVPGLAEVQNYSNDGGLTEIARRGQLAIEFNRALLGASLGAAQPTERIDAETGCGDALAGLYHQWLRPDATPEPPPNAWAWRACRLWQTGAGADDWDRLAHECLERRRETEFLRLLTPDAATGFQEEAVRWQQRNHDRTDPTLAFMRRALSARLSNAPHNDRDTALTVLASAAVGAPELFLREL